MAITWQTSSIELLRVLINDLAITPTYSNDRLKRVLIVSAFQVLREADFTQEFVVDIVAQSITPDPTDTVNATDDNNFINLMCLKAACIIDTGSAILAAQNATAGKDTVTSWDLRGVAAGTLALLEKGWCAAYEASMTDYLNSDGSIGLAVTGPFRTRVRNYYYGG